MRAFIAIDLDPEIKDALLALVRDLRKTRADVRWVDAAGMHLTVKFLGPVDEGQVPRVEAIMAGAAGRQRPFPLRLEGTGAFPNERSPRVLWVGFAAAPELVSLQSDLEAAFETEGFDRESRDFRPHLTLGRVKGPDGVARAMTELAKRRDAAFGSMTVRKITLFESLLRPEGAEYRVVFEAPLA